MYLILKDFKSNAGEQVCTLLPIFWSKFELKLSYEFYLQKAKKNIGKLLTQYLDQTILVQTADHHVILVELGLWRL